MPCTCRTPGGRCSHGQTSAWKMSGSARTPLFTWRKKTLPQVNTVLRSFWNFFFKQFGGWIDACGSLLIMKYWMGFKNLIKGHPTLMELFIENLFEILVSSGCVTVLMLSVYFVVAEIFNRKKKKTLCKPCKCIGSYEGWAIWSWYCTM